MMVGLIQLQPPMSDLNVLQPLLVRPFVKSAQNKMKCNLKDKLCGFVKYTLIFHIILYLYFTYFNTENAKKIVRFTNFPFFHFTCT